MARITVEDCMQQVDNLFDLVLIASKRARQLSNGAPTELEWQNDKPTVVALREIADGLVDREILREPDAPLAEVEQAEDQPPAQPIPPMGD